MHRVTFVTLLCLFVFTLLASAANPTFTTRTLAAPGANGTIVTADFDHDGNMDVAIGTATPSQASGVTVFFGDGTGRFQPTTIPISGRNSSVLQVADFDGDGYPDLIVNQYDPTNPPSLVILHNNHDRTFTRLPEIIIPNWRNIFAAGDFDGDGRADLAVSTSRLTVEVMLGNGDGTFQSPQTIYTATPPSQATIPEEWNVENVAAVADYNGDGRLDFVVSEGDFDSVFSGGISGFLLNQGGLSFVRQSFETGDAPTVVPLHVDGEQPPVAFVAFSDSCGHAQCNGAELWVAAPGAAQQATNVMSVAVTNGEVPAPDLPGYAGSADFNGDGHADIAWLNGNSVGLSLGPAAPNPLQAAVNIPVGPIVSSAMVVADFNNDGAPDMALISFTSPTLTIALNTTPGVAKQDFRLALSPAATTVAAGQAAQITATLTPTGSFAQSVSLSCSDLPAGASCAFTPGSTMLANGMASTSVMINTTARSTATSRPMHSHQLFLAFALPGFGLVFMSFTRRKNRLAFLLVLGVALLSLAACAGMGGGASMNPPPNSSASTTTGTPAGTYTVIVTAQSGSTTHSANIMLTVK